MKKKMNSRDRRARARGNDYRRKNPQRAVVVIGRGINPETFLDMAGKVFARPGYLEIR